MKRKMIHVQISSIKGVKGPSILMNLLYFDLIWDFVVDYMHTILLGVIKSHMEYLFDSTKKKMLHRYGR